MDYLPRTQAAVRAWLNGSTEGRSLLAALTREALEDVMLAKCEACQAMWPHPKTLLKRGQFSKVLVVLRRLGRFPGAEVYSEDGVVVRMLELPEMSACVEARAEELIAIRLPRTWRHMLALPAKRITCDVFRGISLTETLRYLEEQNALRDLQGKSK